jgi:hypothetical protein
VNNEIAAKLETIANSLCGIRLPVREASAYGAALKAANQLFDIAEKLKEGAENDAENQPE